MNKLILSRTIIRWEAEKVLIRGVGVACYRFRQMALFRSSEACATAIKSAGYILAAGFDRLKRLR